MTGSTISSISAAITALPPNTEPPGPKPFRPGPRSPVWPLGHRPSWDRPLCALSRPDPIKLTVPHTIIRKGRRHLFVFMTNRDVTATNNGSERALRPCTVYRKITNGFRSHWGARPLRRYPSVRKTPPPQSDPPHRRYPPHAPRSPVADPRVTQP